MYGRCFKRIIDFFIAFVALVVLFPLLVALSCLGLIFMKGNPFFIQERPGKSEKIFRLLKFRTMDNRRDSRGELLPDGERLNCYGRLLRATSLDELPELINILKGDMALVGPRPLLVRYLDRYTTEQRRRHAVRPGLTGYAQVHGRNQISWENRLAMDVWYVENISLSLDIQILLKTVRCVIGRKGVHSEASATMEEFMGTPENVTASWRPPF